MNEYHVVAYTSQEGRVVHPQYVVSRPNLSQDTHFTENVIEEGNLNITIWWMYDSLTKSLQAAHTVQIIKEVKLKLSKAN